ncbi:MAG TPA: hypothetical protein DCY88_13420 [Cyanobacteria bacterium UBA11372]|nr:hypothetical protein [Cyanobacteria bacterium UBA11372]
MNNIEILNQKIFYFNSRETRFLVKILGLVIGHLPRNRVSSGFLDIYQETGFPLAGLLDSG